VLIVSQICRRKCALCDYIVAAARVLIATKSCKGAHCNKKLQACSLQQRAAKVFIAETELQMCSLQHNSASMLIATTRCKGVLCNHDKNCKSALCNNDISAVSVLIAMAMLQECSLQQKSCKRALCDKELHACNIELQQCSLQQKAAGMLIATKSCKRVHCNKRVSCKYAFCNKSCKSIPSYRKTARVFLTTKAFLL